MKSDENNRRNLVPNESFTVGSWLAASFVLLYCNLYLLFTVHMVFFVLFPMVYAFLKFVISDCINKPYIMDKGIDENAVMVFRDERKNTTVSEFISKEMRKANFWIVIASVIMAYAGFLHWK